MHIDPELERRRMVQLYEQYLQARHALDNCYLCRWVTHSCRGFLLRLRHCWL